MPQVLIDCTQFFYELDGKGTPLVLIAGYSCDHTFWRPVVNELSQKYQILTLDNRGVGQTPNLNQPLTLEMMAEDVFNLIEKLNISNPSIIGHSMGGAIAQILAHKYPQHIRKLILLNTSAKINIRTLFAFQSLLNLLKEKMPFNCIVETSMPWFFSAEYLKSSHNVENFKSILKNNPFPPSIENLDAQLKALALFNANDWVHEIKIPTLVVSSKADICCLPSESNELSKKIPNAKIISIPGGHSTPIEKSEDVCKLISSFINSKD